MPFVATEKINQELLPKQNKLQKTTLVPKKRFNPGEKIYFKKYQNNMSGWERGIILKKNWWYGVHCRRTKYTHKRQQNQLQKRRLNDSNDMPPTEEEPINTIFDMFDLDPLQSTPEKRRSGRKGKFTDPLMINPKRILTALLRSKGLGDGCCGSLTHNGLFSPLLVLRDFAAGRTILELSETVRYLLHFICNSIFLVQYNRFT